VTCIFSVLDCSVLYYSVLYSSVLHVSCIGCIVHCV